MHTRRDVGRVLLNYFTYFMKSVTPVYGPMMSVTVSRYRKNNKSNTIRRGKLIIKKIVGDIYGKIYRT